MIVYMKVTRDEYELPIAIADTVGELARMTGASKETIFSNISPSPEVVTTWMLVDI